MAVTTREAQIASDGDVDVGRVVETTFDEETGVGVGRVVETVVDKNTGVAAERERVVAAVPDGRGNVLLMVREQIRAVQVVRIIYAHKYKQGIYIDLKQCCSCALIMHAHSLEQLEGQVRMQ